MQEMVGGDYNRTPINFWVPDIYRFVGEIYGIARTPPVSAAPTESPIYGYLKVLKIPSIKSELVADWPL